MRDHRPQTPGHLLEDTPIGNIQQRAIALSQLDKAVKAHLACAEHCRVSNFRQGVLIIETASAAWSMRLNYERNTLSNTLRAQLLPSLTRIEIKVNPQLAAVQQEKTEKVPDIVRKPITPQAAAYLRQTAQSAPDKIRVRLERIAALANRNKS
ncbi:DciA family protein [Photobacterium japonica]|uniref:DUF721 domain-containing protein n=1 Tax=Photobacterium japonica TaxID=2910235 RepID=UPI003D1446A8